MMDLPKDFILKYSKLLGSNASLFFKSFNYPATNGFIINTLKKNLEDLDDKLDSPISYIKNGYYGKISGKNIDYISGYIYSQEPSAMAVNYFANAQKNWKVLDLCASPGGKSVSIGISMSNMGLLVSNEINYKRAKVLSSNIERMGLKNVIVTNNSPEELVKNFPHYFDMILVDAPCSGEGMFRKNHDASNYWNSKYPYECSIRQKKILDSAMKMLSANGYLMYSTCTFSPEENEQVISWLINKYSTLQVEKLLPKNGMINGQPQWTDNPNNIYLSNTIRIFPHLFHGEGHFIAKLKNSDNTVLEQRKGQKKISNKNLIFNMNKDQYEIWVKFKKQTFNKELPNSNVFLYKNILYLMPNDLPYLNNLNILRLGLKLGVFKKNRFEPSHAISHALSPDIFRIKIKLNDDEFLKYIHGETINISSDNNGWCLILYHNKPFSLGKIVGNTIKNFYPKGLRE